MHTYATPRVYFSRCLGFEACRWNGVTITSPTAEALKTHVEAVHDCPEMQIGLGVPRKPIRLVFDVEKQHHLLYQPDTGLFFTGAMQSCLTDLIEGLGPIDGFLLKGRSPTCGVRDVNIYGSTDKGPVVAKVSGLLGQRLLDTYPRIPVEEEGRLTNYQLRDRFFTRVFTLAEMRDVISANTMKRLVAFHAKHKLLLMGCNQAEMRLMGKLVANHDKRAVPDVMAAYRQHLLKALEGYSRRPGIINVLMHAFGYFRKVLTPREKARFLDMLEQYRNGAMPLVAVNSVLETWIERTDEDYLRQQSFFAPYPRALRDLTDSGKGRDY